MNHSIAKKKLSKKYLFYSIKIQPQKFAQDETALRETAVAEGYLYKLQSPRGIFFFQDFELIFCVCEYFSILFTIKMAKIGKEKILFF